MNAPIPKEPIRSLQFMTDEKQWPRWPICPLKRPERTPTGGLGSECGCLVAGHGATVFQVTMFAFPSQIPFARLPQTKYVDFNAVIDDGWMVD